MQFYLYTGPLECLIIEESWIPFNYLVESVSECLATQLFNQSEHCILAFLSKKGGLHSWDGKFP